jgi:hypothetical protein
MKSLFDSAPRASHSSRLMMFQILPIDLIISYPKVNWAMIHKFQLPMLQIESTGLPFPDYSSLNPFIPGFISPGYDSPHDSYIQFYKS